MSLGFNCPFQLLCQRIPLIPLKDIAGDAGHWDSDHQDLMLAGTHTNILSLLLHQYHLALVFCTVEIDEHDERVVCAPWMSDVGCRMSEGGLGEHSSAERGHAREATTNTC